MEKDASESDSSSDDDDSAEEEDERAGSRDAVDSDGSVDSVRDILRRSRYPNRNRMVPVKLRD